MKEIIKRTIDIILSAAALLILMPLLLLIAVLIRLTSPGPVLFRQGRLGRHGRVFQVVKFRTMFQNAPDIRNPDGSTYSGENDPRVTAIGHVLRMTSLDELPQLWNVLAGEMSIVGPRPDQTDQVRYYTPQDHQKLQVRPGITGLAQISGRNAIPWETRRRLDCAYAANWNLWLDCKIIARTVPYVLMRRDINQKGDASKGSTSPAT